MKATVVPPIFTGLTAPQAAFCDDAPATAVHWAEVTNVLAQSAVGPASLITVEFDILADGHASHLPRYTRVSRGWRVEPSAPVVVVHHDNRLLGPAPWRAALARYQAALEAAGYTCLLGGDHSWPTCLIITGRVVAWKGGR